MRRKQITAALILILFGVGYGYQTALLPARTLPHAPSPSFFPWLLTGVLLILATALLVQGLKDQRCAGGLTETPGERVVPAAGLLLLIVYVVVLPILGFVVASIPFFAGLTWLAGERRIAWIVVPASVIPSALYGVFRHLFRILLPQAEFWSAMWN